MDPDGDVVRSYHYESGWNTQKSSSLSSGRASSTFAARTQGGSTMHASTVGGSVARTAAASLAENESESESTTTGTTKGTSKERGLSVTASTGKTKGKTVEHPLLVSRLLTCISLGIQKTPGLEIPELYPEGKFHEEVTFFDGTEEVTLPIKPDATLVVEDKRDGRTERLGIFAEADRWTMPLRRATFKQSSFYKKLLAYYHYWLKRDGLQERLGVDDCIVLTVCEEEARTVAL